jgi:UDP:flavonoid glycosyltransferase YjiC (YdhE family)
MRVLFTCLAFSGHFYPLVPFARALVDAGHDVAFAAPAPFASAVEGAGFRHFPAGLAPPAPYSREIFTDLLPRHTIPDLLALAATWPPDLIVRENLEYGGCIAAERLGLPHAVVAVNVVSEFIPVDRLAAPLNALRAAFDLSPDPAMAMLYRYLRLCPFPPSLQDPALPVAPTTHYLRPMLGDRSGREGLPEWAVRLPDRPVVYVGMGTTFNRPEVFRAFIAGLGDEAVTLVVTVGRDQDPADYGPQPENVHLERYIPLSLLLARCDLAVTNGGSGTLVAALGQGLPLVVVPIAADHPQHAARCVALGLGKVVTPADLTPESARDAVLGVLGDPSYWRNAERIREEMAALPGPDYAVALLERLAVERQPLPTS